MSEHEDGQPVYRSSPKAWVDFGESNIWRDMQTLLHHKIEQCRLKLENEESSRDQDQIRKGEINSLKELLDLPEEMVCESTIDMEVENKEVEPVTGLI